MISGMFTIKVVFGRVSPNQFPVEFLPNGNRFLRETGESLPKDSGIQRQLETLKILFCMRIRITFFLERFLGETESLYQTGTKTIEPQVFLVTGFSLLLDYYSLLVIFLFIFYLLILPWHMYLGAQQI